MMQFANDEEEEFRRIFYKNITANGWGLNDADSRSQYDDGDCDTWGRASDIATGILGVASLIPGDIFGIGNTASFLLGCISAGEGDVSGSLSNLAPLPIPYNEWLNGGNENVSYSSSYSSFGSPDSYNVPSYSSVYYGEYGMYPGTDMGTGYDGSYSSVYYGEYGMYPGTDMGTGYDGSSNYTAPTFTVPTYTVPTIKIPTITIPTFDFSSLGD